MNKEFIFFDDWQSYEFPAATQLRHSGKWHCPQHLAQKKKKKIIEITFELRFSDDLRHIWNENSLELSHAHANEFRPDF